MSNEKLKERYINLYQSIFITECYNSNDYIELYAIEMELLKRGYRFVEQPD